MKVFVTGATGFIGSAVVKELLQGGHQVIGLSRSDAGDQKLKALGAGAHRGSLEDLESLKKGAAAAEGVIHLAFVHSFPGFLGAPAKDKRAIDALGSALEGTGKPLVVAGAVLFLRPGQPLTEDFRPDYAKMPRKSEETVLAWAARGVRASVVRLSPTVHGDGDHGFLAMLVATARKKGKAVYVGDGRQRWSAVHRLDAAKLLVLALEKGRAGGVYHGVADEGVAFGDLTAEIGRRLNLPVVSKKGLGAVAALGFLGFLANIDGPASSRLTQKELGWVPTHPSVIDDLEKGKYFS